MDIFSIEQFKKLSDQQGEKFVSIYTPTSRDSSDSYMADKIHFKNQLQESASKLGTLFGMSSADARSYLKPGYKLLDDPLFWARMSDMLVFMLSPAGTEIKTLPVSIAKPMTYVGNSFAVRPLIPLLNRLDKFYILNLNLNKIKLYEATSHTISEIVLGEDVPTSIDDYLVFVERQKSLQFRSGQGGRAGAMFHGHGASDSDKEDIQQYFYQLSKKVDEIMQCEPLPAILAGVEYLLPMYKKASDYNQFANETITGSFEDDDARLLHEKALLLKKPELDKLRSEAFDKFNQLKDGDWASTDLETIIPAAMTGQVETLFIKKDAAVWGSYDPEKHTIVIKKDDTTVTKDLLNDAAAQTLIKGGTVYPCEVEDMPAKDLKVAAIFRNPIRS